MELEKFLRVKEKDDDAPEPAPAAPAAAEPAAAAPAPPAVDPVTEKERQRLEEEVRTTKKRGRRYDLPRASGSFAGRGARDAQLPQHADAGGQGPGECGSRGWRRKQARNGRGRAMKCKKKNREWGKTAKQKILL